MKILRHCLQLAVLLLLSQCQQAAGPNGVSLKVVAERWAKDLQDVQVHRLCVLPGRSAYLVDPDSLGASGAEPILTLLENFAPDSVRLRLPDHLWVYAPTPYQSADSNAPIDTTLRLGEQLALVTPTLDAGTTYLVSIDTDPSNHLRVSGRAGYAIQDITEASGVRNRPYAPYSPPNHKWGRTVYFYDFDTSAGWGLSGHAIAYDSSDRKTKEIRESANGDSVLVARFRSDGSLATESHYEKVGRTERRLTFGASGNLLGEVFLKENQPIEGTDVTFWANGTVKSTTEYRNGVLHGTHRYWHYDGSFGGESHFDHGNGVMKQLYADGTPMIEHPYVDGRKHGAMREWYPNGQQSILAHYDRGVQVGEYYNWYPDGRLFRKALFEAGRTVYDSLSREGQLRGRWPAD